MEVDDLGSVNRGVLKELVDVLLIPARAKLILHVDFDEGKLVIRWFLEFLDFDLGKTPIRKHKTKGLKNVYSGTTVHFELEKLGYWTQNADLLGLLVFGFFLLFVLFYAIFLRSLSMHFIWIWRCEFENNKGKRKDLKDKGVPLLVVLIGNQQKLAVILWNLIRDDNIELRGIYLEYIFQLSKGITGHSENVWVRTTRPSSALLEVLSCFLSKFAHLETLASKGRN